MDIWPPITRFGFYHVPAVMSVIWIEALMNSSSQQQSLAVVYSETSMVARRWTSRERRAPNHRAVDGSGYTRATEIESSL